MATGVLGTVETIDQLIRASLEDVRSKLGHHSFSVYYSDPWKTLRKGDFYIAGTNPGGGEDTESEDYELLRHKCENNTDGYSAYLDDDDWDSPNLQRNIKTFAERALLDGQQALRRILSTNALFVRTPSTKKLPSDSRTIFEEICWPWHRKFLGIVQPKFIIAIGTRTTRVDVRVIAATHRDLERATREGGFREDLYYRLRRVVLDVPPLRARREDISLLIDHYRLRFNERHGLSVDGLTAVAQRRIEAYSWPGNIRELEAVLEEAMILKGTGWLAPGDLDLGWGPADALESEAPSPGGPTLTRYQEEALRVARSRGDVRRGDLVAQFGISRESARRQLHGLAALGLLRRVGKGRGARYLLPNFGGP